MRRLWPLGSNDKSCLNPDFWENKRGLQPLDTVVKSKINVEPDIEGTKMNQHDNYNKGFGAKNSDDSGKMDWGLLPEDALTEVLKTMHYGAFKYKPRNWELGNKYSEYYAAAERHLKAWSMGEDYDSGPAGSGLHHLAHAGFCILSLLAYELRGIGEDDRVEIPVNPNFKKVSPDELKEKALEYKALRKKNMT